MIKSLKSFYSGILINPRLVHSTPHTYSQWHPERPFPCGRYNTMALLLGALWCQAVVHMFEWWVFQYLEWWVFQCLEWWVFECLEWWVFWCFFIISTSITSWEDEVSQQNYWECIILSTWKVLSEEVTLQAESTNTPHSCANVMKS
jgi:hypothetical protein